MSRESKIIYASVLGAQETISHYESFGWELLSLNGNQITMSRETQNPVYADLVKLQAQYEAKEAEYKTLIAPVAPVAPPKVDFQTCLITFVCLVIPFAVYVTYKVLQAKKYKEKLAEYTASFESYNRKRKDIIDNMNSIALEGRAVFFSKQA